MYVTSAELINQIIIRTTTTILRSMTTMLTIKSTTFLQPTPLNSGNLCCQKHYEPLKEEKVVSYAKIPLNLAMIVANIELLQGSN